MDIMKIFTYNNSRLVCLGGDNIYYLLVNIMPEQLGITS
jgi:hypothetical protein